MRGLCAFVFTESGYPVLKLALIQLYGSLSVIDKRVTGNAVRHSSPAVSTEM